MIPTSRFAERVRARRALFPERTRRRRKTMPRQAQPDEIRDWYAARLIAYLRVARVMVGQATKSVLESTRNDSSSDPPTQLLMLAEKADGVNDDLDRAAAEFFSKVVRPEDLESLLFENMSRTEALNKRELGKQLQISLGVNPVETEPELGALRDAFVAENVALIKSIPSAYFDDVEKTLTRAIGDGLRHEEIAKLLEERYQVAESSAKLIARDQVGKYYGRVNGARQQALGITHFRWKSAHDDRVRPRHKAYDGQVYSWEDPPEGGPGVPINCRCGAEPVIDDLLDVPEPADDLESRRAAIAAEREQRLAEQEAARVEREARLEAQRRQAEEDLALEERKRAELEAAEVIVNAREEHYRAARSSPVDLTAFGDPSSARVQVKKLVAQAGARAAPRDVANTSLRIDASLVNTDAQAYHAWNGAVHVRPDVIDNAQKFARRAQTATGQQMSRGLPRMSAAQQNQLHDEVDAMRVLVHEELHGHVSMLPAAYEGAGVVAEEVSTELLARAIMREHFDLDPKMFPELAYRHTDGQLYGSYGKMIDGQVQKVAKLLGESPDKVFSELTEAARALKADHSIVSATGEQHMTRYAEKIADRFALDPIERREFIRTMTDATLTGADVSPLVVRAPAASARGLNFGEIVGPSKASGQGWHARELAEALADPAANSKAVTDQVNAMLADTIGAAHGKASKPIAGIIVDDAQVADVGAGALAFFDGRNMVVSRSALESIRADLLQLAAGEVPHGGGLQVLLHETMHSVSAYADGAYQGVGVLLEEVTTEMSARAVARQVVGRDYKSGFYQEYVDTIVDRVISAGAIERDAAFDLVQTASVEMRKAPKKPIETPLDYVDAVAKKIFPKNAKARKALVADLEALHKELTP